MATTEYPLLDQLQAEVKRVLEQTGRVFTATNKHPDTAPVAQLVRLKQMLPESSDRFHNALDQLEDELQMARLVMRRDLAACRERAGIPPPASVIPVVEESTKTGPEITVEEQPTESGDPAAGKSTEDVSMTDVDLEVPMKQEAETTPKVADPEPAPPESQDEKAGIVEIDESTKEEVKPEEDSKTAENSLQIDTKPQTKPTTTEGDQSADDDKQPDTGTFSNTNDLESLFGGPTSAGPFNLDNDAPDFDFTSFGNDVNNDGDDNLSSLLPGLQDYANNPAGDGGEPDFDALFSTDLPAAGDGQDAGNVDTTFDDLMNFADFGTGDFTAGNDDGSGNNANQDFDFSFD